MIDVKFSGAIERILVEIRRQESRLRDQRMTPNLVLVGSDVYMALDLYLRQTQVTPRSERSSSTVVGVDLRCDPLLAPDAIRVLPEPNDCAYRAQAVREVTDR